MRTASDMRGRVTLAATHSKTGSICISQWHSDPDMLFVRKRRRVFGLNAEDLMWLGVGILFVAALTLIATA